MENPPVNSLENYAERRLVAQALCKAQDSDFSENWDYNFESM
jgi:hypothetical protein